MRGLVKVAVAAIVVLSAKPVAGQIGLERSVVIWVDLENGSSSRGSGVLVCERQGRPQILTAHHVITGPRNEATGKPAWSFHEVCSVRFDFSGGARLRWVLQNDCASGEAGYQSVEMQKREAPGLDLMALFPLVEARAEARSLPVYASVPVTALEGPAGPVQESGQETQVYNMKGSEWEPLTLRASRGDEIIQFSGATVEHGYSGSGIWWDGHLVGLVTNKGRGVAIRRVMEAPLGIEVDCWSTGKRSDLSVAHNHFRSGIEAAAQRDWTEARERMESAVDAWGNEGGILNLRGWRYTAYLPHYHAGRALFELSQREEELSKRRSLCRQANAELEQSLSNGHVHATKYHRRLKKMRGKCWAVLDGHSEGA